MLTVDIDSNSGFCAGVIRAISKAEEFLQENGESRKLYSLGAIVHNDAELNRLVEKGLVTIDKDDLDEMIDARGESLLIRAHGEPPSTYELAENLGCKEYAIKMARNSAKLYSQKKLKNALELCAKAEQDLKTGVLNKDFDNELLLLKLLNM